MKLITVEKILNCLRNEKPEIILDNEILVKAQKTNFKNDGNI